MLSRIKILICGSRDWHDEPPIRLLVASLLEVYEKVFIVHGAQRGADQLAGKIGLELELEVLSVPARWKEFGRSAGPKRNQRMLDLVNPDRVFAFHEDIDNSLGTKNMVRLSAARKITVEVFQNLGDVIEWKKTL